MNPYLPVDKQNIDNIPLEDEDEMELLEEDYIPGLDDGEGPKEIVWNL